MEILQTRPYFYSVQAVRTPVRNRFKMQNLAGPQLFIKNWLTLTNWVPPVNDRKGEATVT